MSVSDIAAVFIKNSHNHFSETKRNARDFGGFYFFSFVEANQFVRTQTVAKNATAASEKFAWVKQYLGKAAYRRLILSHHKHLNNGDFLIDDRPNNEADKFRGELILFGSEKFPNWTVVTKYLLSKKL